MQMGMRGAVSVFAVMAVLGASRSASAEGWTPDTHRSQVGLWSGWWSSDKTAFSGGTVWPLVHFGSARIADAAQIDVDLPTALWIDGPGFPDRETRAAIGNPTIGGRYAPIDGIVAWSVGGRLAVPVASIDDDDWQLTSAFADAAMAGYDLHLWAPNYLPFGVTAGVDVQVIDPLSIIIEVEPTFYAPLRDEVEFEFALQTRVGLEARHPAGFGGGFAVPVAWVTTADDGDIVGDDNLQVSIDTFIGYTGKIFFVRVGNILALDEPLGFAFDDGNVFTPYIKIGAFFDGEHRR